MGQISKMPRVNWWGNWFACIQRSTCSSLLVISRCTRVYGKFLREKMSGGGNVRSTLCFGVISRSTVERVVDECTKFITHWSL